jgi:hypothetical protein
VELLDLLVVINRIGVRMFCVMVLRINGRGLVVLAVVGPGVEVSKVVDTGLGTDRVGNMLEFARLALEYLLEQLELQHSGKI